MEGEKMTTTKILEKMYLMQASSEEWRNSIINDIIKELKAELLKDEAKKNGKTQAKKAADNILRQTKDARRDSGAYIDGAGRQMIGGIYSAVRMYDALPVEELPKNAIKIDYNRFFNEASKNAGAELALPSPEELSVYIKSEKAAHKGERGFRVLWDFGDGLPVVDANYLLDMIYLLPDSKCTAAARSIYGALYFESICGDGVLMPCRKPAKDTEAHENV
jgi:hypothetical protein